MSYILVHLAYLVVIFLDFITPNNNSKFYFFFYNYCFTFFHYKYMPALIYYHQFKELP